MLDTMPSRGPLAIAVVVLLGGLVFWSLPSSALASRSTAIVESRQFGTSVTGLPIVADRIGDPNAPVKVVVLAAMHGDEPGPIRIINDLIGGPPISGVDLWVIPTLNPDGLRAGTRKNARGVDLNRNFPVDWGRSRGQTYSGPGPASEPETRAFMSFLDEVNPNFVISFHQPLRGIGLAEEKPRGFQRILAKSLKLRLRAFNCSGVCHGTMTTWFNRTHPGTAITVEYGHRMTRKQVFRTGPNGLLRAVGGWR